MITMTSFVKNVIPSGMVDRYLRYRALQGKVFKEHLGATMDAFVLNKKGVSPKEIGTWESRLKRVFVKDEWYPEEYFWFNYERLSPKGRKEFVPWHEAAKFWNWMNSNEVHLMSRDKGETYKVFGDFFKRDMVSVKKGDSKSVEELKSFVAVHPQFFLKPTLGNYGNGACVVDASQWQNVGKEVVNLLGKYPDGFVAEELIVQTEDMSSLHPSSINTVRLTTARLTNGEVYVIHRPFLKIGQGGKCVDNGGNGGIIALVDYETGVIKGAIDEAMNRYVVHPDTGKTILGFEIPRWEEAKQLAIQLANVYPKMKYCGWDLALTSKGWVMVEANSKGLFIGFQMPTQEGCRAEFEWLKRACGYQE